LKPGGALALGAGGILGEAWMTALLAGVEHETGFDWRGCSHYVGTSAGSIVAAHLAAGETPRARLGDLPEQPPPDEGAGDGGADPIAAMLRVAAVAAAPLAAAALRLTTRGGALARRVALSQVAPGRRSLSALARAIERSGARFDARLLVTAVELGSGRRVAFGGPGAPQATVARAVEASCAIPGYFRPVTIAGRSYVDGGVWSPTNMDVLPVGRGAHVLCLNPTGSLGAVLGRLSRSVAAVEALTLRRRGATVTAVAPDGASAARMGGNLMDPSRREAVIEAGFAQGVTLARRGL
jgi:NTE family protein